MNQRYSLSIQKLLEINRLSYGISSRVSSSFLFPHCQLLIQAASLPPGGLFFLTSYCHHAHLQGLHQAPPLPSFQNIPGTFLQAHLALLYVLLQVCKLSSQWICDLLKSRPFLLILICHLAHTFICIRYVRNTN